MIVIGLTGYMRAGKDSVADILVREHGFLKMSFASAIKEKTLRLDPIVGHNLEYCCSACGPEIEEVHLSDLYDDYGYTDEDIKESEYGDEVRRLWQRFGTEVFRGHNSDFWVDLAMERLEDPRAERVVFNDVRFPNEAQAIYDLGNEQWDDEDGDWWAHNTSIWRVERPGVDADVDGHASEQHVGLMGEEVTIHNDGTLIDLEVPVRTALRSLTLPPEPTGWAL